MNKTKIFSRGASILLEEEGINNKYMSYCVLEGDKWKGKNRAGKGYWGRGGELVGERV